MIHIGKKLHEIRLRKQLSLQDIEKDIKIKASFLSAIERGDYSNLPTGAHAQGFIGKYAEYLGLSRQGALALYRREFDAQKNFDVLPEGMAQKDKIIAKRRTLSQATLIAIAACVVLFLYIIFQYKDALLNPPITITSPQENARIHSQTVQVSGKTDPNATVLVNNEAVTVDVSGNFSKNIIAFPGPTTVSVHVKNHFGRQSTIQRHVLVAPNDY